MANTIPQPEDYHVSYKYGFLYPDCLVKLPVYFNPWNSLAKSIPQLIKDKAVRKAVQELPELDHSQLVDTREQRCAHLFLSLISSAYVWQEGDAGMPELLPRQLAVPYHAVSNILGIPPILIMSSYVLSNWTLCDPDGPFDLSNVKTIGGLYPKLESDWFVLVTWWTEVQFIPAIKVMVDIMNSVYSSNTSVLKECLKELTKILTNMKEAITLMHDQLDANTFYNCIRPLLAGWGGPSSPLPSGLIYEGVSDQPIQLTGGSAAQSSTIQCIDALLGIRHKPEKEDFLQLMRTYMPPKHAAFIEAIKNGPSLKEYVGCSNDTDLTEGFNQVIAALQEFRSYHIKIAVKYVVCPSRNSKDTEYKSLLTTGTGGTSIIPFLQSLRDTTKGNQLPPLT